MSTPTPAIGRIVQYRLSEPDAIVINNLRKASHEYVFGEAGAERKQTGHQQHIGNAVEAGDVFPLLITRVWPDGTVNGQVFLDGNDTLWKTSVYEGEGERRYQWPNITPKASA